ncbi:hypothetical protein [Marinococcus luteus]|uniref:hypothetical protein n=1 Tax=Marinococcus luteus TaxID=1122204 RepID=UPI002ACEE3F8|nr:hypothetical protein [Marinococcus luteus]
MVFLQTGVVLIPSFMRVKNRVKKRYAGAAHNQNRHKFLKNENITLTDGLVLAYDNLYLELSVIEGNSD